MKKLLTRRHFESYKNALYFYEKAHYFYEKRHFES